MILSPILSDANRRRPQFEITDDTEAVQMLQRSSQVGEYYILGPPVTPLMGDDAKLRGFMDIVVFDEESDRHVTISWEDAIEATFTVPYATPNSSSYVKHDAVVDAGSGLAGITQVDGPIAPNDDLTAGEWRELANCWNYINKNGVQAADATFPDDAAIVGAANESRYISPRFQGMRLVDFMKEPRFRVYCVVARPFIEHIMQSAVMTVAGRDTGAMLFGPSDMQISANTQVKTIEGCAGAFHARPSPHTVPLPSDHTHHQRERFPGTTPATSRRWSTSLRTSS